MCLDVVDQVLKLDLYFFCELDWMVCRGVIQHWQIVTIKTGADLLKLHLYCPQNCYCIK